MLKLEIKKILKNYYFWSILGIIILAGFLRFYKFSDFSFFMIDQARDWKHIFISINYGFENLPILGPKLGGGDASLGPAYYWIIYLSGLIFGTNPPQLNILESLLGLLTVPLSYFFFKEFFSKKISLVLTFLFSISLFAIVYGRFSWNPNTIPFFTLLTFLSLLKLTQKKTLKNQKYFWSFLIGLGIGIGTQLQASTLFGLPIIVLIFWIWVKPKINWKAYALIFISIIFCYSPLILHELKFNFNNTKNFLIAAEDKQEKQTKYSLPKRITKHTHELIRNYVIIISSTNNPKSWSQTNKQSFSTLELIKYNSETLKQKVNNLFFFFCLIIFIFSFFLVFQKIKELKARQLNFNPFRLLLIWQSVTILLTFNFSFNPDSRLYLIMIFIPFILLGLWIEKLSNLKNWKISVIVILLGILSFLHFYSIFNWFGLLNDYTNKKTTIKEEYILEHYYSTTYSQIKSVIEYIEKRHSEEGKIISVDATPYLIRPIKYSLYYDKKIPLENLKIFRPKDDKLYFYIDKISAKNQPLEKNLKDSLNFDFEIKKIMTFGNLVLLELTPKQKNLENLNPESLPSLEKLIFSPLNQSELSDYGWWRFKK